MLLKTHFITGEKILIVILCGCSIQGEIFLWDNLGFLLLNDGPNQFGGFSDAYMY